MAFWRPFHELEAEDDNCDKEFKNKDLNVQCQRIILNMYDCLKRENNQECNTFIVKRIVELTKLSFSTISRVIKEGDVLYHSANRKKRGEIDDGDKDVIRRIAYSFYKDNSVPTLNMIQDKLKDYPGSNYKSLETLRSVLLSCGFKHKNIDHRILIMESKRIVDVEHI